MTHSIEIDQSTNEEIEELFTNSIFWVEDIEANIYKIEVDGDFAGFIAYAVEYVNEEIGWTIYVEAVELLPQFEGKGIYRQLLVELAEQEEADSISGQNEGAKGTEYKNLIVQGSRINSLWVRKVA